MNYFRIFVADNTFHGKDALTYQSSEPLNVGDIVTVPLKNKNVLGIVQKATSKPPFAAKSISETTNTAIPKELVELLLWMRDYYPAPLGITTQLFLSRSIRQPQNQSNSISEVKPELPPLTTDQQKAIKQLQGPGFHLLHGKTGSGKTRVYMELAKQKMSDNKSSIILTPEISLTSQLSNDFRTTFGQDKVIVLHSQLTEATRQKIWIKIASTETPLIIIGPRSALFSPLNNIGLIVVDEAHESAYKQDQAPYYHASAVAAKLAYLHSATLILGSATPLVADYYVAQAKNRPIIQMQQTASEKGKNTNHSVTVVDLRNKKSFTKSSRLSNELINAIQKSLDKQEQVLLFLNRRGTARIVFCDQCAWQSLCPNCDLPLIYHGDAHIMRCHSCSHRAQVPVSCPECGNPSVLFKNMGTKALVDEVTKIFPSAKICRFDTDNKKTERLEEIYDDIRGGGIDILIGTQTLARGLDLPKLSLVGVIDAETGLSFPDFSATERTFQLLSQVLGRVDRGHRDTTAVIQTYAPESSIVKSVLSKKWQDFYDKELKERKVYNFPPFCYLLKLTCKRSSNKSAETAAQNLYTKLKREFPDIVIEGPAASFYEKRQNKYQWQLILKSKNRSHLVTIATNLPANWSHDIDPLNLL